jgi:Holliday junction resolvase RusA-like endonuclease
MKEIKFFVKIEPTKTTHQSALRILRGRNGRMFVGKMSSSPHKKWVNAFEKLIQQMAPAKPVDEPVKCEMAFYFPHLKSTKKSLLDCTSHKTTRPDLDNLEKSVLDCLVRCGFIKDDSLVCEKTSSKWHSPDYGIFISLKNPTFPPCQDA